MSDYDIYADTSVNREIFDAYMKDKTAKYEFEHMREIHASYGYSGPGPEELIYRGFVFGWQKCKRAFAEGLAKRCDGCEDIEEWREADRAFDAGEFSASKQKCVDCPMCKAHLCFGSCEE